MININKFYTPDKMPNQDMKDVAECMGVVTALKLMENFGGQIIYVPRKPQTAIIKEYANENRLKTIAQIARDLNVCPNTVASHIKSKI